MTRPSDRSCTDVFRLLAGAAALFLSLAACSRADQAEADRRAEAAGDRLEAGVDKAGDSIARLADKAGDAAERVGSAASETSETAVNKAEQAVDEAGRKAERATDGDPRS